ncbi:hypothetical protein VXO17_10390, partial [Escherichia coli]
MNGLTATGVTVGICAGLWQLVSSHVGLSQGWELLGTIGFVAFCSFGNDSNLLIVFYVQIMPDDFVMQLH